MHKRPHPFYHTKAVLNGSQLSKRHLVVLTTEILTVLYIFIGRMPFLVPTLYNADLPFTLAPDDNIQFLSASHGGGGSRPT